MPTNIVPIVMALSQVNQGVSNWAKAVADGRPSRPSLKDMLDRLSDLREEIVKALPPDQRESFGPGVPAPDDGIRPAQERLTGLLRNVELSCGEQGSRIYQPERCHDSLKRMRDAYDVLIRRAQAEYLTAPI